MKKSLSWYFWIGLNIFLRLAILYFLIEVMLNPSDPRFAGKAIAMRNLIIVGLASLLFPIVHWLREGRKYPWVLDSLYLSIFFFDMLGNSMNWYDGVKNFDLLPHFHSSGAVTLLITAFLFARQYAKNIRITKTEMVLLAIGLATVIHVSLEVQEYYTDVFFSTHNVGGVADTVNDLGVGLVGSIIYSGVGIFAFRSETGKKSLEGLARLIP